VKSERNNRISLFFTFLFLSLSVTLTLSFAIESLEKTEAYNSSPVILPFPFICGLEDDRRRIPTCYSFSMFPRLTLCHLHYLDCRRRTHTHTHARARVSRNLCYAGICEVVFAQRDVNSNSNGLAADGTAKVLSD